MIKIYIKRLNFKLVIRKKGCEEKKKIYNIIDITTMGISKCSVFFNGTKKYALRFSQVIFHLVSYNN